MDILIPTYNRPTALAVTLTSLLAQELTVRIVISDQGDTEAQTAPEVKAVCRVLEAYGHSVAWHRHRPRRGLAEQRDFLLSHARSRFALFLDDDVILAPRGLVPLQATLEDEACGFVGYGLIGLSYQNDVRPHEQKIEYWTGPVRPEVVAPGSRAWERYKLHNAANLHHLADRVSGRADIGWHGLAAVSCTMSAACARSGAFPSGANSPQTTVERMCWRNYASWRALAAADFCLRGPITRSCRRP